VAWCHRTMLAYWKFESISLQRRVYKLSVPGHVGQPTTGRATTGSGHFTRTRFLARLGRPMTRPAANSTRRKGTVRCAIYCRKSSEEGLEQAFNSLQAQREACEAFIISQRHEGWACECVECLP
jgi:hypothetical protein